VSDCCRHLDFLCQQLIQNDMACGFLRSFAAKIKKLFTTEIVSQQEKFLMGHG